MQAPQDQFATQPQQQAYLQPQQQAFVQPQQMMVAQPGTTIVAPGGSQPSVLVAYLLWFFLGFFGIHHLYMGRGIGVWLIALISFQGFSLWWFIDLFLIPGSCAKNRSSSVVVITQ
jgi:hypothetical protein